MFGQSKGGQESVRPPWPLVSELTDQLRVVVDAPLPVTAATPADAHLAGRLTDAADIIDRVAGVA